MAGRGLRDVFDYFVSPEEQREARERTSSRDRPRAGARTSEAVSWGFSARPDRPLRCTLAIDMASTLALDGRRARIVACFAMPALLPRTHAVEWQTSEGASDSERVAKLTAALRDGPGDRHTLVVAPDAALLQAIRAESPELLPGLILPVDAVPRGVASALQQLRALDRSRGQLRIAVLMVGAASEADAAYQRLAGSARLQLGLELESLGSLQRDATCDRSLLAGRPVVELDANSSSAKMWVRLGRRLCADPPGLEQHA